MEQDQNTSLFSLNLDAQNSYTLRSAASWAKVLGVVGLILGFLFVVLGILVQQMISRSYGEYNRYSDSGFSASSIGNMGMVAYVIMGLIFIISSVFALNAGNKINGGLKANDQGMLNAGFAGARNYFAFWAIMIILMLLMVLISVMGMIGR